MVAVNRLQKKDIKAKYAHPSDWIFIVMLALTTISGILVHIFRLEGMVGATYYTYVFHLAILVPMLLVEVPFSKWSHLAYRPFAIYFARPENRRHRETGNAERMGAGDGCRIVKKQNNKFSRISS